MEIAEVVDWESLEAYLDRLPPNSREEIEYHVMAAAAARSGPIVLRVLVNKYFGSGASILSIFDGILFASNIKIAPELRGSSCSRILSKIVGETAYALPAYEPEEIAAYGIAHSVYPLHSDHYYVSSWGSVHGWIAGSSGLWGEALSKDKLSWSQLREDLKNRESLGTLPLWSVGMMPQHQADDWTETCKALRADKNDWRFWIAFYNRLLDGKDIHAALLAPILSKLSKEDWLGDPALVTPLFDDVLAVYDAEDAAADKLQTILRLTPHAMRVQAEGQSLIGRPSVEKDLTQILEEVRLSLKDFLDRCRKDKSPNKLGEQMLAAFDGSVKTLRRDLRRYKTDAGSL